MTSFSGTSYLNITLITVHHLPNVMALHRTWQPVYKLWYLQPIHFTQLSYTIMFQFDYAITSLLNTIQFSKKNLCLKNQTGYLG